MFSTDSLNMAMEELGQLAFSCATLKNSLGTVTEEVTNASREFEDLVLSQHLKLTEKEASPDMDGEEAGETEFVSSLSIYRNEIK